MGRYGATSITLTDLSRHETSDRSLLVTARDGTARQLRLDSDGRLRQTGCLRLPWDWVAGAARLDGGWAIVGFHGVSPEREREPGDCRCCCNDWWMTHIAVRPPDLFQARHVRVYS